MPLCENTTDISDALTESALQGTLNIEISGNNLSSEQRNIVEVAKASGREMTLKARNMFQRCDFNFQLQSNY